MKKIIFIFLYIICINDALCFDSSNIGVGTGFYIDNNGYILTAYHIIKNHDDVIVKSDDDTRWRHADIIKVDPTLDLALLHTDKRNAPYIKLAIWDKVPVGLEISAIGYPMLGFQGMAIRITQGIINSDEGINGQKKLFQLSAEIEKGNSGGPIIAPDGSVVGMVLSKLNALSVAEKIQDLPQNINFGIKTSMILKFLEGSDAAVKSYQVDLSSHLRPYELLRASQPAIVRIVSLDKEEAKKYLNDR